jgi:hypothetical protein
LRHGGGRDGRAARKLGADDVTLRDRLERQVLRDCQRRVGLALVPATLAAALAAGRF